MHAIVFWSIVCSVWSSLRKLLGLAGDEQADNEAKETKDGPEDLESAQHTRSASSETHLDDENLDEQLGVGRVRNGSR